MNRPWKKLKTKRQKWNRIKGMVGHFMGRVKFNLGHVWYWVRTHTYNRYHIVDCRNKDNGYTWGWCDRDQLMLYACFAILVDFVEKEEPDIGLVPPKEDYTAPQFVVDMEIRALYTWWKEERKQQHDYANSLSVKIPHSNGKTSISGWSSWAEAIQELDKKDNEMLDRLVKVREYLWT